MQAITDMNLSKHAQQRMQQRGISRQAVDYHTKGGWWIYHLRLWNGVIQGYYASIRWRLVNL